ncbi:hypothetical protein AX14_010836 [Amanita brunnescens Koide BX004]|nr:hypothetical protein AX14_010836 [Amanita brunnescens Koide BX004]
MCVAAFSSLGSSMLFNRAALIVVIQRDNFVRAEIETWFEAPTGSGRTVFFELAILRTLRQARDSGGIFKCVHVSPTKGIGITILALPFDNMSGVHLCPSRTTVLTASRVSFLSVL